MADEPTANDLYAGDLSLEQCWKVLSDDERAVLIDVRTEAEWNFVGVPELSQLGKRVRLVEWVHYPSGASNGAFVEQAGADLEADQPVLLLCRSGARSQQAAMALTAAGFGAAYNVSAGFEGHLDQQGHRHGGWKESLPWRQG